MAVKSHESGGVEIIPRQTKSLVLSPEDPFTYKPPLPSIVGLIYPTDILYSSYWRKDDKHLTFSPPKIFNLVPHKTPGHGRSGETGEST